MESPGGRAESSLPEAKMQLTTPESAEKKSGRGTVRIASIGELGGGTSYFGRDNAIGFYNWLKERISDGKAPDHIVFHGEAFPEISKYGNKSGKSKSLVLTDFVDDYDDSVVAIKPYLSRTADIIKRNHLSTGITYVMGPSDFANMEKEHELVLSMFNYNPEKIVQSREGYQKKTDDTQAIIDSNVASRVQLRDEKAILDQKLASALKGGAGDAKLEKLEKGVENYRKRIEAADEKIAQLKEELNDYTRIRDLYNEVLKLWISTTDLEVKKMVRKLGDGNINMDVLNMIIEARGKQSIDEIHEEVKEALERTRKAMDGLDPSLDKNRFNELEEHSKNLSGILKKTSHQRIEKVKEDAEKEKASRTAQVQKFTNNLPGSKPLIELADEIATQTIMASIKDAFGRQIPINIVKDNYATIDVKGLKVRVTNRQNFTNDASQSTKVMLRTGEDDNYDVLLGARSPYSSAEPVSRYNKSKDYVYTLTSAPFVDVAKLEEAWNGKIKTKFTDMFQKTNPSSGFDELEYDGYGFKHTFVTSQGLAIYADNEKKAQARALAKEIRGITPNARQYWSEPPENRDVLNYQGKLPTELRATGKNAIPKLLTYLGVDITSTQQRKELADHIEKMDFSGGSREISAALKWFSGYLGQTSTATKRPEKTDFMLLTDVHIGSPGMGVPQYDVLDGLTRYLKDQSKSGYVLAMLGDNLEGLHKHIQNELHPENDPLNMQAYKDFLVKKGISQSDPRFEQELNAYLAWQHKKDSIPHLDSQPQVFAQLTKGIIEGAQAVFIVSGNHWNKTFPERNLTEANTLEPFVKAALPKSKQDKVFKFDGGDSGFGVAKATDDAPDIRVAHKGDANMIYNRLRASEWVTLLGDKHIHKAQIIGNKIAIIGLPIQGMTLYPESIGMSVTDDALRGMSGLSVVFAGKDTPVSYTDYFISVKELKERGYIKENPLIKEFEATRNDVTLKKQKVKI